MVRSACDSPEQPPWTLHGLLNNVTHNAVRHSPCRGRVTVRCGSDGGPGLKVTCAFHHDLDRRQALEGLPHVALRT